MTQQLRLGIPAGSLQEATAELFRNAGFKITFSSRSYYPAIDDPEITDRSAVRSVVLCSGKIAYKAMRRRGDSAAVVRVDRHHVRDEVAGRDGRLDPPEHVVGVP